jgi:Helix-turn-helix of DDE superfamily endonuclease
MLFNNLDKAMDRALKSHRVMMAMTGMTPKKFLALIPTFGQALQDMSREKERLREPGAGAPHTLDTPRKKLFFTLVYLKCYPTFDLAGMMFGVDRSRACRWVHRFVPALERALGEKRVLPLRQVTSMEEFFECYPQVNELILDGTERPMRRSKDKKVQKKTTQGKDAVIPVKIWL